MAYFFKRPWTLSHFVNVAVKNWYIEIFLIHSSEDMSSTKVRKITEWVPIYKIFTEKNGEMCDFRYWQGKNRNVLQKKYDYSWIYSDLILSVEILTMFSFISVLR